MRIGSELAHNGMAESGDISARILVLFAHPAFQRSRVNRVLAAAARSVVGVTFHDLYEAYPDFDIDVAKEQELLLAHDFVVFQHPFFWYSTPAILKEWQDLVLEHGWAYGSEGTALRGKTLFNVISTGGREDAYQHEGHNRFTMRELLAPIEQTARLCGMHFLPPFVVHGTLRMTPDEMEGHSRDYGRLLEAIRDGRADLQAARSYPRLNSDLDQIVGRS
ncbi:MAG: NAD(P)H-dependent oxidoreductase [Longimicrobiales bacterium]|nr:NAD(P)H-dependent oxidoreductase [Longimicrobiales bacterium]